MNLLLKNITNQTKDMDGIINIEYATHYDPRPKTTREDVQAGQKVYAFCSQNGTDRLSVYSIKSIGSYDETMGRIGNIKLVRENSIDDDEHILDPMIVCTTENYIDDIPSGDELGFKNSLSQSALIYNLTHRPSLKIVYVNVSDIHTDETAEDGKQHYIDLQDNLTNDFIVQMQINGVTYLENDDFQVDRENKKIYFDTDSTNNFSFNDLMEAATDVRLIYMAYN